MRPKSLILLALALGCGLVAAVGINQILATPSNEKPTVTIVVAKQEIKKGDMIKPEDLRLQEWHVDALPEGSIQKIDDLAERRVKTLVVPGEAILESKLVPKNGGRESEIPPGMKGVAVKVDNVSGGAGLILPGDNVDVLIHVEANAGRGIPATVTKELLKNVKVHAVDDVLERPAPGEPSIPAKTVTLLVNPKQAAIVTHATEIGNIRLVLRSEKDGNAEDGDLGTSVSTNDVLGNMVSASTAGGSLPSFDITPLPSTNGVGNAMGEGMRGLTDFLEKMRDARNLGTSEPPEQPWRMVIIEGNETKEMEFTKDSKLGKPAGGAAPGAAAFDSPLDPMPPLESEKASE
jgi:pilus assembly protein CpaB